MTPPLRFVTPPLVKVGYTYKVTEACFSACKLSGENKMAKLTVFTHPEVAATFLAALITIPVFFKPPSFKSLRSQ